MLSFEDLIVYAELRRAEFERTAQAPRHRRDDGARQRRTPSTVDRLHRWGAFARRQNGFGS